MSGRAREAMRRLGEVVPLPYPVPARRDRFGSAWCPCCECGLSDPGPASFDVRDGEPHLFCPGCDQEIDWSRWDKKLSAAEVSAHGRLCSKEKPCFRCVGLWP